MLDLLIIGAGPGGISMAVEAVSAGIPPHKILILEKGHEHSWSIRKFYPEGKLVTANYKGQAAVCSGAMCLSDTSKDKTLTYLDKAILDHSINVHYNENVHQIKRNDKGIFSIQTDKVCYQSKTCVIAIGMMGRPNKPQFKVPSNIKSFVHYDITSTPLKNKNILVIGGGDSASEYAQYLIEQNNTVTLSYRRAKFNRLNQINLDAVNALYERKELNLLMESNIESLSKNDQGVIVKFTEDSHCEKVYDHIILALGGSTPKNFLSLLGIKFVGETPEICDGHETSIPGLFLIGDLSAGKKGGSIISAFNSSHVAMKKICTDYLNCSL